MNKLYYTSSIPSDLTSYHSMYNHWIGKFFQSSTLESASYQGNLESVNNLEGCAVWVNFWGKREIVTKRDGDFPILPISLDAIADKIIHTTPIDTTASGETLSPAELKVREEIVEKIQNFYSASDALVANSNFITRIFNLIQEQFNPSLLFGYPTRWCIESRY